MGFELDHEVNLLEVKSYPTCIPMMSYQTLYYTTASIVIVTFSELVQQLQWSAEQDTIVVMLVFPNVIVFLFDSMIQSSLCNAALWNQRRILHQSSHQKGRCPIPQGREKGVHSHWSSNRGNLTQE